MHFPYLINIFLQASQIKSKWSRKILDSIYPIAHCMEFNSWKHLIQGLNILSSVKCTAKYNKFILM